MPFTSDINQFSGASNFSDSLAKFSGGVRKAPLRSLSAASEQGLAPDVGLREGLDR